MADEKEKPGKIDRPQKIELNKLEKLELENTQLKIDLSQRKIESLHTEMRNIINKINTMYQININDYQIDFDAGILYIRSGIERGV